MAPRDSSTVDTAPTSFDLVRERHIGDDLLCEDRYIRVRDGNYLAARVYRRAQYEMPAPAILSRTPYDPEHPVWAYDAAGSRAAKHGYVLVVQSVRGRYDSTGVHYPLLNDRSDAYDTIDWIVS